ncbi:MAG TPA: hypothetical protein ENJ28_09175 [Gammaproteobacteria bacterium]|nr:hypothetical protein [Gammaproteobacteria bacterium]
MSTNASLFVSLISLLFIIILVFWLYRDYRVDKFRQKMFELRDDLFDDALRNNLPFNSTAYGMMRSTINGFIRFAHRINLPQTILFVLISNKNSDSLGGLFFERLEENKKELNDEQRKLIDSYCMKMNYYLVEHLILSSPLLLFTILVPLLFIFVAKSHARRLIKTFKSPLDKLDTSALTAGEI